MPDKSRLSLKAAPLRRIVDRDVPGTYNGVRLECGHVIPRLMFSDLMRPRMGRDNSWHVKAKRCLECPRD